MKNFKTIAAITLVVTSLINISVFADTSEVATDEEPTTNGRMGHFKLDIDEETEEAIEEMMEDGATREEIDEYLEEQGYDVPEKGNGERGGKGGRGQQLDLDDDTQEAIDEMMEDGATKEEIAEYLTEQGYEMPEKAEGERGQRGMADFDEDTKEAVDEMIEDDATREEITEYLTEQGYEIPEKGEGKGEGGKGGRGMLDLDEDTQEVVDEMIEDGASREEVMEYLEEQGYEMPEKGAKSDD